MVFVVIYEVFSLAGQSRTNDGQAVTVYTSVVKTVEVVNWGEAVVVGCPVPRVIVPDAELSAVESEIAALPGEPVGWFPCSDDASVGGAGSEDTCPEGWFPVGSAPEDSFPED